MDRDKKITLSLFLTWVVFGLFNLFGQPEAFVPPIIVDGVIIAGLGIYFLFPLRKNIFYPAIVCFTFFIAYLSLMELGWIEVTMTSAVIAICLNILFIVYLSIGFFQIIKSNKKISFLLAVVILSHSLSISLAIFHIFPAGNILPLLVYAITFLCAFISIPLLSVKSELTDTLKRLYLLIILHFLFDIGNYLALLQFQP